MSVSSVSNSNLSSIYNTYKNNSNLVKTLTGNSQDNNTNLLYSVLGESDDSTSSILNGITNLDNYVASTDSSVNKDSTTSYSQDLLKKDFNLTNLTNALNAINDTQSFSTISNIDEYVSNLVKNSQTSEYATESNTTSALLQEAGTNLTQDVIDAYKSNSVLSNLASSKINTKV